MAIAPKEAVALQNGAASGAVRDDARLVAALRAGEEGAFARLVADYQTAIYNLAWRTVRDREDARDITQDVFLKAYRQIPRVEGELHLWAWLYRVTVNACYDHLRAGSRRPVPLGDREEEADRETGDGQERAELAGLFNASLAQLTPKQQVALLLKDVHGLQHSDIAAALGISRGSSEVLLFRARRSFRSAFTSMTEDGGDEPVCRFAEQAAAHSVGGRLTEARRRRVLEHARTCADCRRTVDRWSGAHAVGLGLALPLVAAPQIFGAHAATAAAAHVAASAGASAGASAAVSVGASASAAAGTTAAASAGASAGASAAASVGTAAAASTALSAGASSVAGGLTAKIAGFGIAKAAVVVVAAASVATYGGAAVSHDYVKADGHRAPAVPVAAAAAARSGDPSASPSPRPRTGLLVADASVPPRASDQRLHQRRPGLRRAGPRDGLRLRRVAAGRPGLGRQARRALRAAALLRGGWRPRTSGRPVEAPRHGAQVAVGGQWGVPAGIRAVGKVRSPGARAVRQGARVRPPGARSRVKLLQPVARTGVRQGEKADLPRSRAAERGQAKPRPVGVEVPAARPARSARHGTMPADAKPRSERAARVQSRQGRSAGAGPGLPAVGPRGDRTGVRQPPGPPPLTRLPAVSPPSITIVEPVK